MNKQPTPKIVIVGAGFGGITIAKSFKNKPVEVLLIDQHNYHNFQPLMYQIATGGLEPDSIAYPVRRIFRNQENFSFRMAKVDTVAVASQLLHTSIGTISYDYLVIATGSTNNFFNFEPVKDKLLTLKSIPDALNMRSYIYQNLEKALAYQNNRSIDDLMNIAIVGGGPAGIELAGALAEMKHFVLPKDFPELDLSKMQINIYEAAQELLSAMSEASSIKSLEYLWALTSI
ncbi:NAD(P)/FAD-dependent oxidoreductase [Gelidibacter sp.]|uniref:NAD(P)/FAD-dependent oxidoreductase n=1 Tax=Gelidibacter sp. TaxID=2018083 RepID=UPI002BD45A06|nr:FAD-dependent oxidoreductase [Gelidibacter sp.]HUH27731.1 FAD-dependent oxidoreductase [Gelidibacter sp.]